MSKKAIWLIIGLMTIGLLGSSLIQVYWFNWSMKQQESRFDTNVIEALNKVEERLSSIESKAPFDILNTLNQAPSPMIQQEIAQFVEEAGMINEEMRKYLESLNDSLFESDKLKSLMDPMDSWQRQSTYWELLDEKRRYDPPDISERIDPKKLTLFIDEELKSRNINLPYQSTRWRFTGVISRAHPDG